MPDPAPTIDRAPALTLPAEEARALRLAYDGAQVILEYGSGGSTALAAGLAGRRVFSVESDRAWLDGLESWFAANRPAADLRLHHADIGPTGKWGRPTAPRHWGRFHHYPMSVWDRADFEQPDVVLIDGRFRTACYLTVLFRTRKPVLVLFDDYIDRPAYRAIERYGPPAEVIGRMALFEARPTDITGADLPWIMDQFAKVQ